VSWVEIVEDRRNEKETMKKRKVCQYMILLETVQTKLRRETQVTGSPQLTLPGSLIADLAFKPNRGMKLAFVSK